MAGERGKRRVPNALHQAACIEIADSLGFKERDVWYWFQQIAWALEMETSPKWPRAVCEWQAYRYVRFVFDKRGAVPS